MAEYQQRPGFFVLIEIPACARAIIHTKGTAAIFFDIVLASCRFPSETVKKITSACNPEHIHNLVYAFFTILCLIHLIKDPLHHFRREIISGKEHHSS